jgi:two-component system, chemotaxis family, sensor kinase CheA
MAIDVSKFHQTFFEESLEGLDTMEASLLELEDGSGDTEVINTIFRAAHSIKGGAATLGFTAMAELTHLLETILDRRRSGHGEVTEDTVDVLLASVDCLRDMFAAAQLDETFDAAAVADVEVRLQRVIDTDDGVTDGGDGPNSADGPGNQAAEPAGADDVEDAPAGGWHITFAPFPGIFRTGNDPVRVLGELADLGTYDVEADVSALPELEALDVEISYASWTVELRPTEGGRPIGRFAVKEVFEWVEDDAEITVSELEVTVEVASSPSGDAVQADTDVPVGDPSPSPASPTAPATPGADVDRRSGTDRRQEGTGGSIRVDIDKVDTLINMVGELVITQSMLQQLASQGEELDLDRLRAGLNELEANTRELQANVMHIRMLPISFAFSRLPRLVRDLATKLGKSVELQIAGETTELDKTVMEKIGDPLVHLVRNSLDHGIELPEERLAAGKPETGTVSLSAYHEGGSIVVEITDDGSGLRADRILAKAQERGLVGDEEKLSERQIHELVFHPGFSTAEEVSDVSGRGVGMDVVKRNINDLGGVIEVVSAEGEGTTFRIRLPLTLAILDGQCVRVGSQVFIIPLTSIVESLQIDRTLSASLSPSAPVYRHRDVVIPLIDLSETLASDHRQDQEGEPLLVVVDADGSRAGLIVDDLLNQQQVVIKSLSTNFRPVPGLSGATILGDGTVAMILDVNNVLSVYQHTPPAVSQAL